MTLLSVLIIGFLLGLKHALESDHLAAVATLATGEQSLLSTIRQGVAWGLGHTVTLVLVGGIVLMLGKTVPVNFERALELCVGLMLIGLGADVVRRVVRERIHFHVHRHRDGEMHVHAHRHPESPIRAMTQPKLPDLMRGNLAHLPHFPLPHALQSHEHDHGSRLPLRAVAVGMMHGLAGSAALVVLSLQTAASIPAGIGYIALFGAGSIAGMAALSTAIAIPLRLSGRYLTDVYRGLTVAIGVATLGLGAWIVITIGFIEGMLLA
jgi:ABC-type nickel/cobalt efflux system permease component RcnA